MFLRRACVALLSLAVMGSAGLRTMGQTAAKKKPVATAKKPAGPIRRAPVAKPFTAKKTLAKKGVKGHVAAGFFLVAVGVCATTRTPTLSATASESSATQARRLLALLKATAAKAAERVVMRPNIPSGAKARICDCAWRRG